MVTECLDGSTGGEIQLVLESIATDHRDGHGADRD